MHHARPALVCALCLGLGACAASQSSSEEPSTGQSYAQALGMMCDVDRLAGVDGSDPLEASSARENYLLANVENPDGIYFLTIFRSKGGNEQAKLLADEARRQGLPRCALADQLKADASGDADAAAGTAPSPEPAPEPAP